MPICTRCGSSNEEGARLCGNCGVPVSGAAIPNPPGWTPAAPVVYGPHAAKSVGRKLAKILGAIFLGFVLFVVLMPKARTPDSTRSTPNDTTTGPAQPTPNNSTAEPAQAETSEVKVGEYNAVLCPTLSDYDGYRTSFAIWWKSRDSDWEDEIDGEVKIDADANGCSTVPSGTPMKLESKFQEAGDSDPNDAVASVTMRASDGTTVRGFTEADSLNEQ